MSSDNVYVVPAVRVREPVVALEPLPLVVADASLVAPCAISTVN